MPKESQLESDIIETMLAGLKQWRPDLSYPESASDMQGCVRALMIMYDVKRRPLPQPLASPCSFCEGTGYLTQDNGGTPHRTTCRKCEHGKVYY
jgi:hypothetical protein